MLHSVSFFINLIKTTLAKQSIISKKSLNTFINYKTEHLKTNLVSCEKDKLSKQWLFFDTIPHG